jgi:hypothetical protein
MLATLLSIVVNKIIGIVSPDLRRFVSRRFALILFHADFALIGFTQIGAD